MANFDLKMENIKKSFGNVMALRNVSLHIPSRTIHALIGENGAGKSTLMKILAGIHQSDEGLITLGDKTIQFKKPQDSIQAGISMIYQELNLVSDLTVVDNIFLGLEDKKSFLPLMIDNQLLYRKTQDLLRKYGLNIDPSAKIRNLSAADCQLVEFMKSIVKGANIIVMDEPTSSLSHKGVQLILSTVKRLQQEGKTIIFISHNLSEIRQIADDITIIRDGETVHHSAIKKIDNDNIIRHMVGRTLTEFFPNRKKNIKDVMFEVKNLSDGQHIAGIDFHIKAGEIVGMSGLIGAGRTEIANLIFGADKKHAGKIFIHGDEVIINSPRDAIKRGIAFLTEDRNRTGLFSNLPNVWNITYSNMHKFFNPFWIDKAKEIEITKAKIKNTNIKWSGPFSNPSQLSGGNKQKLLLTKWLLTDCDVIIFDEPTRGIDVGAKYEIYKLINQLAVDGKAILMISSELEEVLGITDRVLVMKDFKIVKELITDKTNQDEVISYATGAAA